MPFEIVNQNDYLLIKLVGEAMGDEEVSLHSAFEAKQKETSLKLVIIQCSECSQISTSMFRNLSQVYRIIKAVNGQIRMVGGNKKILEAVKYNGLDRIFVNRMSLRGALVDFGLMKKKDFDVNFINPFLNATQKVFKIQCFIEAKPQKAELKKPTDPLLLGDVSGIISVNSETFAGTFAISLSEKIFLKMTTNMLGEPCTAISEQNVDLVGELANMILGQAKIELAQLGYIIQMALPSCVWGKDHKIKHFGSGVCVVIPFQTEEGTFYAEIMTNNNVMSQIKGGKTPPAGAAA